MATTIAEIAKEALDAVAEEIPDAILSAELFENVQGAYDGATASHPVTETSRGAVRAILSTQKPIGDVFPGYVVGPMDELFFLEGLSNVPKEGWLLRIAGHPDRTIKRAQDILGAGAIAYVVAS